MTSFSRYLQINDAIPLIHFRSSRFPDTSQILIADLEFALKVKGNYTHGISATILEVRKDRIRYTEVQIENALPSEKKLELEGRFISMQCQ